MAEEYIYGEAVPWQGPPIIWIELPDPTPEAGYPTAEQVASTSGGDQG
jgi:hypothetical protein